MNINRHNYEEYFILYMDNELSSADRRLVEDFIAANPDLKDELDTLLQYKLEPDTSITFANKESLLVNDSHTHGISLSNYDEWLLLYTDNELDADGKVLVEQFCAKHPAIQKELDLLLQAKLPAETIVFADKASLYRKEEKVRPLFTRWMKYAAAVLLLLISAAIIILSGNKKQAGVPDEVLAKEQPQNTNPVTPQQENNSVRQDMATTNTPDDQTTTSPAVEVKNQQQPAPVYAAQPKDVPSVQDKKDMPEQRIPDNSPVNNAVVKTTNDNRPSNNLPQPLERPGINNNQPNNTMAVSNLPQNTLTTKRVTNNNPSSSDIQNASFPENNNTGEAFADAGQKKNKLRGFFRKVTRTFEKRTNIDPTDGEDRLLVAGLSIRMK
ncbi:MAG: hypothetical protein JNM88_09175 [Chitinophagaceae bacterium]|nr:hypothetical protein [Chitinophagaceae bacterium]